jgi:hypothetical protein
VKALDDLPSHRKGDYTEAVVVAELKRRDVPVSLPFGDNERYDLVLEDEGRFVSAQVKTGRLSDGTITFHGKSAHTNSRGNVYKPYHGDVDVFLVFCHELSRLYLVREDAFDTAIHLRVDEPDQRDRTINWAESYEFDERWPPDGTVKPGHTDHSRVVESIQEREIPVFRPLADDCAYDVLLESPDGTRHRTSILPGWLVDGRVRFDTGGSTAPGPDETDLVVVHCEELDRLYLVRRDEYDVTISFRVDPPAKPNSRINWAEQYAFEERWPPEPAV